MGAQCMEILEDTHLKQTSKTCALRVERSIKGEKNNQWMESSKYIPPISKYTLYITFISSFSLNIWKVLPSSSSPFL